MNEHSKDVVVSFLYDLKLTLEIYKTAIISGSLLLPISATAFYLGRIKVDKEQLFSNLITLNISTFTLIICTLGYIVMAFILYFGTVLWTDKLYGVHIKNLDQVLKDFNAH